MCQGTTRERRDRIREIVLELSELEDDELDETSLFIDDYGLDSMVQVEIVAAVEREYTLVIDDAKARRMTSLSSVREVVAQARNEILAGRRG
ncbi:acyl carrier protein [Nocardiopsis sp. FIRDI 009]|uniref:acyl carrier protein n=1 Tax=Nocardiopsis sp. FIRDI 009 TaxID=714197 RepID=UPI000E259D49|nr:phosphopantetheine-binding protein [Nocardiopsis sp. FIRDI 009]